MKKWKRFDVYHWRSGEYKLTALLGHGWHVYCGESFLGYGADLKAAKRIVRDYEKLYSAISKAF